MPPLPRAGRERGGSPLQPGALPGGCPAEPEQVRVFQTEPEQAPGQQELAPQARVCRTEPEPAPVRLVPLLAPLRVLMGLAPLLSLVGLATPLLALAAGALAG